MINESFAVGTSVIHRLDPRLRVVFTTVFAFFVAFSKQFPTLVGALIISMILIYFSESNLWEVAKRLTLVNVFNLIIWLLLPFTYEGDPLFHLWSFTGSYDGVVLAAQITFKSNTILLAFIGLIATMSIATLGHALNRIYLPDKIVYLLLMTYRYVTVIEQEYQRLIIAAKVRGFLPKSNMHTYKTYAYMFGMLLVRAMARAERVYQAMLCRGFKGKFYCISEFSFTRRDWIWSAFLFIIVTLLGVLEWIKTA